VNFLEQVFKTGESHYERNLKPLFSRRRKQKNKLPLSYTYSKTNDQFKAVIAMAYGTPKTNSLK